MLIAEQAKVVSVLKSSSVKTQQCWQVPVMGSAVHVLFVGLADGIIIVIYKCILLSELVPPLQSASKALE